MVTDKYLARAEAAEAEVKRLTDEITQKDSGAKAMGQKIAISNVAFEGRNKNAYMGLSGVKAINCTFDGLTLDLGSNAHIEDCHIVNCILVGDGWPYEEIFKQKTTKKHPNEELPVCPTLK